MRGTLERVSRAERSWTSCWMAFIFPCTGVFHSSNVSNTFHDFFPSNGNPRKVLVTTSMRLKFLVTLSQNQTTGPVARTEC